MLKQESDPDSLPVRDKDNIIAGLEFPRVTQGSFRAKTLHGLIKTTTTSRLCLNNARSYFVLPESFPVQHWGTYYQRHFGHTMRVHVLSVTCYVNVKTQRHGFVDENADLVWFTVLGWNMNFWRSPDVMLWIVHMRSMIIHWNLLTDKIQCDGSNYNFAMYSGIFVLFFSKNNFSSFISMYSCHRWEKQQQHIVNNCFSWKMCILQNVPILSLLLF